MHGILRMRRILRMRVGVYKKATELELQGNHELKRWLHVVLFWFWFLLESNNIQPEEIHFSSKRILDLKVATVWP